MDGIKAEKAEPWTRARFLDQETLRSFSRRCLAHWLGAAAREWATIFALMWLCNVYPFAPLWVLAIIIIGSRQHALGVLMHDAAHYLATDTRRWNDFWANYVAAYPLFFPVQGYRTHHLEHHALLETPADPERLTIDAYPREFTFPMPARRLCWLMFRDVIGGSIVPMSRLIDYVWAVRENKAGHITRIVVIHATAFGISAATGYIWTYLLLWVVPAFSTFPLFFRLRTAAEHSGIGRAEERYRRDHVDALATTRTMLSDPVTKYLFSPYNIAYHTEHHLYPSVPGFRLPKLRQRLLNAEEFVARSHVTYGLKGLFSELTRVEA